MIELMGSVTVASKVYIYFGGLTEPFSLAIYTVIVPINVE